MMMPEIAERKPLRPSTASIVRFHEIPADTAPHRDPPMAKIFNPALRPREHHVEDDVDGCHDDDRHGDRADAAVAEHLVALREPGHRLPVCQQQPDAPGDAEHRERRDERR